MEKSLKKAEVLIEEALQFAIDSGIRIERRSVLSWEGNFSKIIACNALGAILIQLNKTNLVKENFDPNWLKVIYQYLGENVFWIHRFIHGFDYNNQLSIVRNDFSGFVEEEDLVSRFGIKLAKKYVG